MSALALFALTLALAPEPLLRDPQARAAFDAAQEAFAAKDYAEASKQLERAYMLEPELDLLYPWAQAERNLGRCESAIDLYQKFIDGGPNQRMIDTANQNIARCEESLAAAGAAEPEPEPPPQTDDDDDASWFGVPSSAPNGNGRGSNSACMNSPRAAGPNSGAASSSASDHPVPLK